LPDFFPSEPPALLDPAVLNDHHYRLPPNYRRQWEVANLYPLLIHLTGFGQAYQPNILQIIQRFWCIFRGNAADGQNPSSKDRHFKK
jgi:fructosamine-3-kinase